MGFSISGFLGGFASAGAEDIREKERRAYEEQKAAMEEARMVNRQVSADRRRRQEEIDTLAGELEALGYESDTVAEIMRKGKGAATLYTNVGMKAWEKGLDPNTLVRLKPGSIGSQALAESISETASTAAEPKALSEDVSVVDRTPTDVQTDAALTIDRAGVRELFQPPEPVSASFGAEFARLAQVVARNPDSPEAEKAQQQTEALMGQYKSYLAAEDKEDQDNPTFNLGTLEATRTAAMRTELGAFGFKTDLEGNITNSIEGEAFKMPVAELRAAQYLEGTYGSINDPNITNAIGSMRTGATQRLNQYINTTLGQYSQDPANPPSRLKFVPSVDEVIAKSEAGAYNVGDVLQVNVNNQAYNMVYTGIPDEQGFPFYWPR